LGSIIQHQFQHATWNGVSIRTFFFVLSNTGYNLFPEPIVSAAGRYQRVFELSFLALFFLCLITLIVLAFMRREKGFNPYLLLACTIGALIIPAISNDYKLPLIIGPVALLLVGWPAMKKMSKKITSTVLLVIVLMAFWSTLYPFKVKPEILHNNMLVLLLILVSVTVANLLTNETKSLNLVAGLGDESKGEHQNP
jgi:uncharacterized membrane protein YoaK (UPF0700 family)